MIEWTDTAPDVQVAEAEYQRLLGYPPGYVAEGRAAELAALARAWYAEHGRPWMYARQVRTLAIDDDLVRLDDVPFASGRLRRLLHDAHAESAVLAAVTAGDELEREAARRWRDEKPDEYFFLEILGSAIVEHLVMLAGARLCAWADGARMAVLPHDSPGYPEWDIAEQPRLLDLLCRGVSAAWPAPIEALESGALRPKKALLAVFGLTAHVDRVARLTTLVPCQSCSLAGCRYRRVPYGWTPDGVSAGRRSASETGLASERSGAGIDLDARYRVNLRALRRWSGERLAFRKDDDDLVAVFRYDGTTCTNMGRPLAFVYEVRLGPQGDGFPVRALACAPAPGDTGYAAMCRYQKDAASLMRAIDEEVPPVAGLRLDEARSWQPQSSPAGCYCDPASREHKWGLVLETIHYALAERERRQERSTA